MFYSDFRPNNRRQAWNSQPRSSIRATRRHRIREGLAPENRGKRGARKVSTAAPGNPWPPDEIAKAIKIKSWSSNLAEIIRSTNLYGLTDGTYRAAIVALTDLGRRLVYPRNDEELLEAKREALLSVELFKEVVSYYTDGIIPILRISITRSRDSLG